MEKVESWTIEFKFIGVEIKKKKGLTVMKTFQKIYKGLVNV